MSSTRASLRWRSITSALGDHRHPRVEATLAAERVHRAQRLHEGFLGDLLGFVPVAGVALAEAVQAVEVAAVEVVERLGIAVLVALDEVPVATEIDIVRS